MADAAGDQVRAGGKAVIAKALKSAGVIEEKVQKPKRSTKKSARSPRSRG